MANQKHLTEQDRVLIQEMLAQKCSFKQISKMLDKDPSTISKEVRNHIIVKYTGYNGKGYNACIHRHECELSHICNVCKSPVKHKKCKNCIACNSNCSRFEKYFCPKLKKPPYVCNSCPDRFTGCTLEKHFYYANEAQKEYLNTLSESRKGFNFAEEDLQYLDSVITPLIKQGQSPHNICINNPDTIMISESSIYRLINASLLSAQNVDLSRKVRFRIRKKPNEFKVDKACRIGRTYDDFQKFMEANPDTFVTELDSVEGKMGGKVLLTIHFVKSELMLAFLRDHNDSKSVTDIFNYLYHLLGPEIFSNLFQVCLTDNGSEFSNPKDIEFDENGIQRTRVFYCDANAPYQKGSAERNHEFIRYFIPKGKDFSSYSQDDISLMMDHINSYSRKSLGNKTPYEMFAFFYGKNILDLLKCHPVSQKAVTLNRSIFSKEMILP